METTLVKRKITPESKEARRAISRLPSIPPHLAKELNEAESACLALISDRKKNPSHFGILFSENWDSDLLPLEFRRRCTKYFVEMWLPLEQRLLRARAMIQQYTDEPESQLTQLQVLHALELGKKVIISERQSDVAKQPRRGDHALLKPDGQRSELIAKVAIARDYANSPNRKAIVYELMDSFEASESTVVRALKAHGVSRKNKKNQDKPTVT